MTAIEMPRKRRTYTIDERLIETLAAMAADNNLSANRYLENLLTDLAKKKGYLDDSFKALGETRGGDRSTTTEGGSAA